MEFLVTFDENGDLKFANKSMQKSWNRVRDFYSRTGTYFKISVEENTKNITEKQIALFIRICATVANETGNDFIDVKKEFLKLLPTKDFNGLFGKSPERRLDLEELTTVQFQEFLESVVVKANEFTNSNYVLYHDDNIGTVFTTKKKDI